MKYLFPTLLLVCLLGLANNFTFAQQSGLQHATRVLPYKIIEQDTLKAWIYFPPKHDNNQPKPAIVFFFGGGWNGGTPSQFAKHCEYLAARGMVAITVDYRVYQRQKAMISQCVNDAKSAIRWVRQQADHLGVLPNRIVAAGGSAGGHLAASTATLPGLDDPNDDLSISAQPNVLALFNPVLVFDQIEGQAFYSERLIQNLSHRMGATPNELSPYHHIKPGIGPTIIFHGTADKTVEYQSVVLFQKQMLALGNQCTLIGYEGEEHAFFNYLRKNNAPFIDTVHRLDQFLVTHDYLTAPPLVTDQ